MKYILGTIIMIWSIFSSAKEYPQVQVKNEDGFVDMSFTIFSANKKDNGNTELIVKGMLEKKKIGFAIELLPKWNPQEVEGIDEPLYWGEANFKSLGDESVNFVKAIADQYGATLSNLSVPKSVHAQVVGLACNPEKIFETSCKTKFFFNSDQSEDLYSEVYINIDLNSKSLEFNEKDNEYRAPLLRSLIN